MVLDMIGQEGVERTYDNMLLGRFRMHKPSRDRARERAVYKWPDKKMKDGRWRKKNKEMKKRNKQDRWVKQKSVNWHVLMCLPAERGGGGGGAEGTSEAAGEDSGKLCTMSRNTQTIDFNTFNRLTLSLVDGQGISH